MPTRTVTTTVTTTAADGTVTTSTTTTTTTATAAAEEGVPPEPEPADAALAAARKRGFPIAPEEVSVEFLSETLGAEVASFECDVSKLAEGVLADAFRVELAYADAEVAATRSLPSSVFLKVTKHIAEVAEMSVNAGHVYEKEVYFYQELVKEVAGTIRVPKCYGVFSDAADPGCREFCLVMESFEPSEWRTYDQFREPMTVEDLDGYLDFLAQLHGCTWDIPINEEQKGLGAYMANWHPLAETIVGKPEVWEAVRTDWKEVFGRGMLEGFADPAVGESMVKIMDLMVGPQGVAIDAEVLRLLRTRPRALNHGDARGTNIFRKKDGAREFALIDWQMWAAGAVAG